jgi:FxsC-like protein
VRDVPAPDPASHAPFFFLSYAHTPRHGGGKSEDPDVWVTRLFDDLCSEIRTLAKLQLAASAGFMDHQLLRGHDWPSGLSHALATCRVFVPLYSPRYFQSEHCGMEWSAFTRRVETRAAGNASQADLIIPALWVPVDRHALPAAARSVEFPHEELGAQYARVGYYGIMKLSRYREEYKLAVAELARRIVAAAKRTPVEPDEDVDYPSLPSAFGAEIAAMKGDQRFRITIAALRKDELPAGRSPEYYGATAQDWAPYRPASDRTLADYVADLVRSLGFRPDVGALSERAAELLAAESCVAPEILVIDPWATQVAEYRDVLSRFDLLGKPWVQIFIPWSEQDGDNPGAEDELRRLLDSVLRHKIAQGRATSVLAVRGVPTLAELGRELPAVIQQADRQYLKKAAVFPPEGDTVQRMRISVGTDPSDTELPGG